MFSDCGLDFYRNRVNIVSSTFIPKDSCFSWLSISEGECWPKKQVYFILQFILKEGNSTQEPEGGTEAEDSKGNFLLACFS